MINQIMAMFLPSIIALKMHNKLEEQEEKLRKEVETYFVYVMFINIISYAIVIYLFKQPNIVFTPVFTIKYVVIAILAAIIIPIIEKVVIKPFGKTLFYFVKSIPIEPIARGHFIRLWVFSVAPNTKISVENLGVGM